MASRWEKVSDGGHPPLRRRARSAIQQEMAVALARISDGHGPAFLFFSLVTENVFFFLKPLFFFLPRLLIYIHVKTHHQKLFLVTLFSPLSNHKQITNAAIQFVGGNLRK